MRGSTRDPSLVRKWPLKSMEHTSLGWTASVKGSFHGAVFLRRRRLLTRPARSRMVPAVLGAGQGVSGSSSRNEVMSFLGPHVGLARLASINWRTISGQVAFGWVWGALLRSPSPHTHI